MAIQGIEQPEYIEIDSTLRLRKWSEPCDFALPWYQDEETLLLVDGANQPYDMEKLMRMYHYLETQGEEYYIEARTSADAAFVPIGDATFWQDDMPIVIGEKAWRGKGVGKKVVQALISRAKVLGFTCLRISEIYEYNIASQSLFKSVGFRQAEKTEKGCSYVLGIE